MTLLEERPLGASPEALIKEARRRQRLRWFAAIAALLVMVGIVAGVTAALGGSSTRTHQTTSTTLRPVPKATTQRQTLVASGPDQPQDIAFVDSDHGWIVEARQCTNENYECGSVIKATADGGRTWRTQYHGPGGLQQVSFTSPLVGWAWGGACEFQPWFITAPAADCHDTLVATSNGTSWHSVATPPSADKFAFSDALHGFAATQECIFGQYGNDLTVKPVTCPTTVFKTNDGGHIWQPVLHVPDEVIALGTMGTSPIAIERIPVPNENQPSSLEALLGSSGGTQWADASNIPLGPPGQNVGELLNPQAVVGLNVDGSGWIAVTDPFRCGENGCPLALDTTNDGGRSWIDVTTPGVVPNYSQGHHYCSGGPDLLYPAGSPVATLGAVVTGNAFCADPDAWVSVSVDGGRTWKHTTSLGVTSITALTFSSAHDGWLLGQPGPWSLIRTVDGGIHWTVVSAHVPVG